MGHNPVAVGNSQPPCFLGYAEAVIDDKLRLTIASKFKKALDPERDGSGWVCVPWPSGHLILHPEKQFFAMAGQLRNRIAPNEDESELWSAVFGMAERLDMDSSGRVILPKRHLELTGVGNQVVMLGANFCLEIHDKARREARQAAVFGQLPGLVRRIEDKNRSEAGN